MISRICGIVVVGGVLAGAAAAGKNAWTPQQEHRVAFAKLRELIAHFRRQRQDRRRWQAFVAQTHRPDALFFEADRDPADVVLRRTAALLGHLRGMAGAPDLSAEAAALAKLQARAAKIDLANAARRYELFEQAMRLRRKIAFANPLLDFQRILFIKREFMAGSHRQGNHMCDQYFGFHTIRGGGLFVLDSAFSDRPTVRDLLASPVCQNGRFQGRKLPDGGYLSPELSYDAKTILFAFTEAEHTLYKWTEGSTFHIFKVNVGGSDLRQLTDGPTNDFDPCWLPNGRIVFISERRGGFGRCHARPVPLFTLHTMRPDGSDIVCISRNEANEWHPSVDHDGRIVYTRWDYVDRGHNQAHHPWITTPDGRDARVIQGNYAPQERLRPCMEMDMRAIPGSHRYVATAAAHHGQAYGSLVLLDPNIEDDDAMGPLKRLTPEVLFPESGVSSNLHQGYAAAWPLSEDFHLCVYDANGAARRGRKNNYGIYLLDAFGNKILLYRDPGFSCLSPIPLRPRPRPPIMPHFTALGTTAVSAVRPPTGETPVLRMVPVAVINVFDGRLPWPEGTVITHLRIIQLFPKATPHHHQPRIGYGVEKNARGVLGTVPVEADGSAHFELPAGIPVYFQALGPDGLAVQSMRSAAYVHPGERLVCQGCHERRPHAPPQPRRVPLALRRGPSKIRPDVPEANPFSFPRLVQPVLERNCVPCHVKKPKAPDLRKGDWAKHRYGWYASYANLRTHAFYFGSFTAEYDRWVVPRTTPGKFGARASKLYRMLTSGHNDVKLSAADLHRITLWLDCNSEFFGAYHDTAAQARGEAVRAILD